uniref:Uncharacterized protein n=1 Tax=Ananas comosus var. bracteatus TaxID=296719 RepID=A0A6V7NZA3_ANACO|nr:unnamed protein product [Ananas comosus var. bracteatus]
MISISTQKEASPLADKLLLLFSLCYISENIIFGSSVVSCLFFWQSKRREIINSVGARGIRTMDMLVIDSDSEFYADSTDSEDQYDSESSYGGVLKAFCRALMKA